MRTLRGELFSKVAAVSLVAAFLAGCSGSVERFGPSEVYTANTNNQRQILGGTAQQPSYQDIVNGPGGTAAGLPQSAGAPVSTGSINSRRPPVQSAPLPAPVPAAPAVTSSAPIQTMPAPEVASAASAAPRQGSNWRGWTATGGTRVQMRQGDSLRKMARRYGVPIQALVAVNGIEDPDKVKPGQTIIVPTYVYAASNGNTSTTEGETGRVKLPRVTSAAPVTTASVPAANGSAPRPARKPFSQPSFADISQRQAEANAVEVLRVSTLPKRKPAGSSELVTASISNPAAPAPASPQPVAAAPSGTVQSSALPAPQAPAATKPQDVPQVVASVQPDEPVTTAKFRWPVRGRIISDFGAKPGGGKNEGVNLAVPEGTPVKAADDGTVIYSGNELKGYGNLVLVRHDEGYVSAYAHNSQLNVKRGDTVRRGDTLALAGATGSVNQPQVHFEIRKGNKPVDPLKYLPKR
ncbi:M23 family metallopeptidase [Roseibium denhamense]|nr:M23 family metallopeptidase [Roseibium denhamense]